MRTSASDIRRLAFAVLVMIAIAMTSCAADRPAEISQIVVPTWRERSPYQIESDGVSLAWHALVISKDTYVVYSLASQNASVGDTPLVPIHAYLRYKPDFVVPLIEATNVDHWDDVSIGVLRFPGPPENAAIVQLELAGVRAKDVVLDGRWDMEMIYDTAPESDAYTLMPLWTPSGPVTQNPFDIVTSLVYPQFNAEFDNSNAVGEAIAGETPKPLPTSTPPIIATGNDLLQTLIVQGINPATQDRRSAKIEIGHDGTVSVDTAFAVNSPALAGPPGDQSIGESPPDLADDAPSEELTIDEAVSRSPVAIWQRTGLDSDVHLEKIVMHTLAQSDDAVVLTYSDGISLGQYIVAPGVNMSDQMAISDAVDIQMFDMNGVTVSGIGAGFTKSVITGEQIPYKGTVWWESKGIFHSITGDATFEALAAIAKDMRPIGE